MQPEVRFPSSGLTLSVQPCSLTEELGPFGISEQSLALAGLGGCGCFPFRAVPSSGFTWWVLAAVGSFCSAWCDAAPSSGRYRDMLTTLQKLDSNGVVRFLNNFTGIKSDSVCSRKAEKALRGHFT